MPQTQSHSDVAQFFRELVKELQSESGLLAGAREAKLKYLAADGSEPGCYILLSDNAELQEFAFDFVNRALKMLGRDRSQNVWNEWADVIIDNIDDYSIHAFWPGRENGLSQPYRPDLNLIADSIRSFRKLAVEAEEMTERGNDSAIGTTVQPTPESPSAEDGTRPEEPTATGLSEIVVIEINPERDTPLAQDPSRKADATLLENRTTVTFRTAQLYLNIGDRQRQRLMKSGALEVVGGGKNKKITVQSLIAYLPPVNPDGTRHNPT